MLKEGEEYIFTAGKEIETPDGKLYRILQGPDNVKYLLRADYYKEYEITEGKRITCRVDKINCRGEVFLEPRHPVYEPGKQYKFKVVSHEFRSDDSGNDTAVILVEDVFGNKIALPSGVQNTELPASGSEILLTVERIFRGRPVLYRPSSEKGRFKGLKYGEYYDFRIEKVSKGIDGEEIFVVSDPFGRVHTIPVKYFSHYNINPGSVFKGRIIKHSRNSSWKIEPRNPYYNKDDIISLKVESVMPGVNENSVILTLKDEFGFVHLVNSKTKPENKLVKCRVKTIRKGKPELSLL
ncbi:MAG TPA: hypothetical protein P5320_03715 [Bacteroidales bacterium]|nr:hypothetical protein [Bacteroidales bacterium]HOK75095.1 hypothetical protein [Bacteroidales bacterium]HOM40235.1 hypothetical protein [Bacteroidales bacterium]HPP92946.1 hypothetical protein [Bacteroidales bacterium]HQG55949.1 hypothetical protein [Bacteroidales bacterium]